MTQRLRKLDARIEIISILASEVGILGNAPPPTVVPFASYCEAALRNKIKLVYKCLL